MSSPLSPSDNTDYLKDLVQSITTALKEDVGNGDITASLLNDSTQARAKIVCKEEAVICGRPWVDEVLKQVDAAIESHWLVDEGLYCPMDSVVLELSGSARSLLTAERCALNFLQTLSGTATTARQYSQRISHTQTEILDTRKTLPGLRLAQKYAVKTGGCSNHRMGLYDAFLIKENHIAATGSITAAITKARDLHPQKRVEVEVENMEQLEEALTCSPDVIMLDNFSNSLIRDAVELTKRRVKLEASGNYHLDNIVEVAETGVDFISIGALTKHCTAIDFSMRFE